MHLKQAWGWGTLILRSFTFWCICFIHRNIQYKLYKHLQPYVVAHIPGAMSLLAGTHHTQKAADLSVWEGVEKENLLNKKITVI